MTSFITRSSLGIPAVRVFERGVRADFSRDRALTHHMEQRARESACED
jgi:hypothetical protein